MASRMAPSDFSPSDISPSNDEYQPLPPPLFQQRMLIAFNISIEGLRREFVAWPDFVAKVELMKFKRYYAYVYASSIYDPLGVWDGPDRPPGRPAERLRVALIGPDRPRLTYFNKAADSLQPDERRDMCHLIGFTSGEETSARVKQPQGREPLRVQGPQFNRCKFGSAYLYTSKKLEIIGACLTHSSRGPDQRWMILDEDENKRLGRTFIEDQGRIEQLQKEYHRQHPDEPKVWYTKEDGKLLLDGIDINIGLAHYSVPVEAFLDLDDQDIIEDPCDFEAEVSAIRRALYEHYKALRDSLPMDTKRGEIATWANSVQCSDFTPEHNPQDDQKIHVQPNTLFGIGIAAGFLCGISMASLVFSYMLARSSQR